MTINYTTGYAGTGKSTALIELSHQVDPNTTVIIAPTHKALDRLRDKVNPKIPLSTIHALLGLRPGINENAEKAEHIDITYRKEKEFPENLTTVIIDEGGMISEEVFMSVIAKFEELYDYETDHITIHVFLDPYQLLPVKGKQMQVDEDTTTHLTTQHRSESPDVVALFTKFVDYLNGTNSKDLTLPASENVIYVDSLDQFQKGDRLLAYTNEAVGRHNKTIATMLGYTSYVGAEVQIGNMTSTHIIKEVLYPDTEELVKFYEAEQLLMQDMQLNRKFLAQSMAAMVNNKHIDFVRVGGYVLPVIFGTHHAAIARKKAREDAIEDKRKFVDVYALGRAYTVDYSFASTVHKAQGSEFDRVWIDKNDILKASMNNNYQNYARMMYVALSRAKKKIFIYNPL